VNQSARRIPVLMLLAVFAAALFASTASAEDSNIVPGHYIVVLEDSVRGPAAVAEAQTEQRDGELGFVYRHALKGYSAELSKEAVEALRKDPRVKFVAPDHIVEVQQETPTGIARSFAASNETLDIDEQDDVRVGADVAVIDTGIDHEHPDLNVIERTDCITEKSKCVDDTGTDKNGHGTHVAGTVGALDDEGYVVGVAPGARLWAVKVLNAGGFGTDSSIAAGVDWVTAHAEEIEATNMSIGCDCSLPATAEAIVGAVDAGVVIVVAAGNDDQDSKFDAPANHPDVITVSALADFDGAPGAKAGNTACRAYYESIWGKQEDDSLANFSSWGKGVEIAAPGVCILSTLPGKSLSSLYWGTSMATPHVTGAAAILAAKSNPENREDVEAIGDAIIEAGNFEWKDTSGDGVQEPLLDLSDEELFDLPNPPFATTDAASSIGIDEATLNATVNPHGLETTYQFEYGLTTSYGTKVPLSAKEVGSGEEGVEVAETISGLKAGATYHYRVVASNADGVSNGEDRTFTAKVDPRFAFDFGEAGSGNGQFSDIGGIDIDASGNLWVADSANNRVQKFNAKGEYLSQFGSAFLSYPAGIAIDSKGNLWISDGNENSVTKYSPEGKYLSGFGFEGSGNGQFAYPSDLAIDPSGNLWVADFGNNRVQKFNSEGKYLAQFGAKGTGNGQFQGPSGIAIDPSGNLWVADSGNNRIQKFSSSGAYQSQFGSKGAGDGQLNFPYGIEVDPAGNLWVADTDNARVQKFNAKGGYLAQFGTKGEGEGQLEAPFALAADASGHIWVTDYAKNEAQKWTLNPTATTEAASAVSDKGATLNATVDPNGLSSTYQFEYGTTTAYGSKAPASPKSIGSGTSGVKVAETIEGLIPSTTYHYRVIATNAEGTAYGEDATFTTKADLRFAFDFGSAGTGNGQFSEIYGIAIDASGNLWVADTGNNRVQKFNAKGEYLSQFGGPFQLNWPTGIAIDASGNLWIADSGNTRVVKYNAKGEYQAEFGTEGSGNGQFIVPMDLAIDASGNLWVTDAINDRVQKFDSSGKYLAQFGSSGTGNGQFSEAFGIDVDAAGNLWVVDSPSRIQKFDSSGEYLAQYGSYGSGNGQFKAPTGIEVDASGNVWVADGENNRVQKLSSKGEYLAQFGTKGEGLGQFLAPTALAAGSAGDVWVADTVKLEVQKWVP
jgi:DNA-binding beta-propeller fold protein YncE